MIRAFRYVCLLAIIICTQPLHAQKPEEKKADELPVKTAQTLKIDTDEGTWLSLDVSPDGKTIVFELLGDIYTIPIGGGDAKKIIGGLAFDSQPRFSPDGKKIAFVSDRSGAENIWIADADGSNPKPLTKGRGTRFCSPCWTADGQYVIASKATDQLGPYSLMMYHKDGGSGLSVAGGPAVAATPQARQTALNKMGAVSSPDNRFIYFTQRSGSWTYNQQMPQWQVHRLDRETGDITTITSASGSAMRPCLSPDGKRLVYATRFEDKTGLRIRDLETGDEKWLCCPVTRDDQESRATRDTFPGYSFMPDGRSLVLTSAGKIQRLDVDSGKMTVIPFHAVAEVEIAPRVYFTHRVDDSPNVKARIVHSPILSPDGKKLAFTAFRKLWIMDFPGGKPRRVTSSEVGEFMPSWSPDGKFIVYATWQNDGGQIMRASALDFGVTQALTTKPAYYISPVYTPDGSKVVYMVGSAEMHMDLKPEQHIGLPSDTEDPDDQAPPYNTGGIDLRWMPSTGGESHLIGPALGGNPHFTTSSQRVYLNGGGFGGVELISVRLDGTDRRSHLKITGSGQSGFGGPTPPGPDEIRISPDGSHAFVDLQNRHFIVTIPRLGKEAVTLSLAGGSSATPVKKLSVEGGDFVQWLDGGKAVAWSMGNHFYRQGVDGDKAESTEIVVEMPRAKPSGKVVLKGARIVSMKGDEIIENGEVLIDGNRIAAVGKSVSTAGAKVIDVRGKTVIPGFVDVHSHMRTPSNLQPTQVWSLMANLAYGVTTTRDPQTHADVFDYSDMVDAGEIIGPRMYSTGPGIFPFYGLDDKDTVKNLLKRYKESYNSMTLKQYMAGDRLTRQWIIQVCKELGITSTTEGGLDQKLDLTHMADGYSGNEHTLPIVPMYKDVAQFVAQTGTFYTPTLLVSYGAPFSENWYFENMNPHNDPKVRRFHPHEVLDSTVLRRQQWFHDSQYGWKGIAEGAAKVVRSGGRACMGSHGEFQGLGAHWEIWSLAAGGLTPLETLRCATLFGAEAIGLQQDLGSLEPGKLADLIVLDKNPLTDIHNTNTIRYVMKNGTLYEGDTLDEVWPNQKKAGPFYWQNRDPN